MTPEPRAQKKPAAEETLQFLKREEVRTMAKDVALLRAKEATGERERIAKMKTEEPQKVSKSSSQTPEPQPVPPSLMPHGVSPKLSLGIPKLSLGRRTRSEKIIIRVIIIGVLLFILANGLAFGYWYLTRKKAVEIIPSPQLIEPEGSSEPERPAPITEVKETPVVFFDTAQEKTIEVAATDSLPLLLSGVLKEEYSQGFTRILIKEGEDTAFFTAREFLNKAGIAMPEPLLSLVKEDFMLFVYTVPGKKRLGFIGELSQTEGVQDMLKTWETTLEQDMRTLWEIVGQKGSAYSPFFRQAVWQNNLVRFQTFSVVDFGVVYTLVGTKLILTTSFESATKAVDLLIQNR